MSHRTNPFARLADTVNREGFEWLMHPFDNYRYYQAKYNHHRIQGFIRYFFRALFTLAVTVIPVLPALYVATRLAVIADFKSNKTKAFLMMSVYAGFTGAILHLGFGTIVNAMTSLAGTTFAFMPALVPAPFIVAGVLMIACATLLYGAKRLAQAINKQWLTEGLSTSGKHVYPRGVWEADSNLASLYKNTLGKHMNMKKQLRDNPDAFKHYGNGTIEGKIYLNRIDAVEAIVDLNKSVLYSMETMIRHHHDKQTVTTEYVDLFGKRNLNATGTFYSWKAVAKNLHGDLNFDNEDQAIANIALNTGTGKLQLQP